MLDQRRRVFSRCLFSLKIAYFSIHVSFDFAKDKDRNMERRIFMGEMRQFRPGYKAPNDGIYIEVGEQGDSVMNPKQVRLAKGDPFPETSNHNRKWVKKSGQ